GREADYGTNPTIGEICFQNHFDAEPSGGPDERRKAYIFLDGSDELSEAGLAELSDVLRRIPEDVRFVISGRCPPRLPLSRLRMRGLLTEITTKELVFTRSEMRQVLG